MLDRYTKGVLTVIALSLAALAVSRLSTLVPIAQAQASPPQKRCVWTVVLEGGKPSLGQNGEIKMGEEWKAVSEAGFELKAGLLAGNFAYIFERCEGK
jgi:hypothetical protein